MRRFLSAETIDLVELSPMKLSFIGSEMFVTIV